MSDKVFLFIDKIPGDCKDTDHTTWIPINSFHFNVSRSIEHKIHTEDTAPHSGTPKMSQITISKPTCTASANIYKSLMQLEEHRFIIDIVHTKDSSGDNYLESAASAAAGSGCTRFEIAAGHVSDYEVQGLGGSDADERVVIEGTAMTISYNPSLKSTETKSSFGYDFKKLKTL